MDYYCNICRKSIRQAEFSYSMNMFGRPLCREHQELERRTLGRASKEYYCNICRKSITKAEFSYSRDKFGRALCREHQESERKNQDRSIQIEQQEDRVIKKEPVKISLGKKVVLTMGKDVKKGIKKVIDFSRRKNQEHKWKRIILVKMKMNQLIKLCEEQNVSTKKTIEKEGKYFDEVIETEVNCTNNDLVSRLRNEVSLDAIISFAHRNHINIKKILDDIEQKKTQWEIKDYKELISKNRQLPDDFYQSPAWGKIRKLVLKRDNLKCKHCGALANHVDHISSARIYPEQALNLNNLISSCKKCHKERHGGKGFKKS